MVKKEAFMCTAVRFDDNEGNLYFGRNLDWAEDYGEKVVITPNGYKYNSAFLGEMTPKNGAIIGMAVVEENVPLYFDCANEAGLAIAGLNFPGCAKFADTAVDGKTNVAQYEFPLWVCMNFSSVDEAEEALKNTVIVKKPISEKYPASELHYLISDQKRAIVVEYTENGMEIHEAASGVLTNAPKFEEQLKKLEEYGDRVPGDWSSEARFSRAVYLNQHYPTKSSEDENVLKLFHILAGVAVIEGAKELNGAFEKTIYTGGYSVASRTYYFNTYNNPAISHVSMDDYELGGLDLIEIGGA